MCTRRDYIMWKIFTNSSLLKHASVSSADYDNVRRLSLFILKKTSLQYHRFSALEQFPSQWTEKMWQVSSSFSSRSFKEQSFGHSASGMNNRQWMGCVQIYLKGNLLQAFWSLRIQQNISIRAFWKYLISKWYWFFSAPYLNVIRTVMPEHLHYDLTILTKGILYVTVCILYCTPYCMFNRRALVDREDSSEWVFWAKSKVIRRIWMPERCRDGQFGRITS